MKKTTKIYISLALSLAMIMGLCLPSFAAVNAFMEQQVELREHPGANIYAQAVTYSSHDGDGNVGAVWGTLNLGRCDRNNPYVASNDIYGYAMLHAYDGNGDNIESTDLYDFDSADPSNGFGVITNTLAFDDSDDFETLVSIYSASFTYTNDEDEESIYDVIFGVFEYSEANLTVSFPAV